MEALLKQLTKEIQEKNIRDLYFFYGEENYLKDFYTQMIIDCVLDETTRELNLDIISDEIDIERLKEKVKAAPFFAERRVLLFRKAEVCDHKELLEIFKNKEETTCIIIDEESVSKKSAVYKYLKEHAFELEMKEVPPATAVKWSMKAFKEQGVSVDKTIADHLVERVGTNLYLLKNEIEKLVSYKNGKAITTEDVNVLCIQNFESSIFELLEKLTKGEIEGATKSYHNHLLSKEPPVKIEFMIAREFQLIYQAKRLEDAGYGLTEVTNLLEQKTSFTTKKYISIGRKYSEESLKRILNFCLETDIHIKKGIMEAEKAVELLMNKIVVEL